MFDNQYMERALKLACIAQKKGDIPVGAVIVDLESKKIIGEGYNSANISHDPTLHAELIALRKACLHKRSKILSKCCIYITLEPCAMCATALSYAQIQKIYYAASDSKFGAVYSNINIFNSSLSIHTPKIYGGILEEESKSLLKRFFKERRESKL